MRINSVENSAAFKSLKINNGSLNLLSSNKVKNFEKRLANTKHVDVIIDSYSFSIKDKKTEIQNMIQSFSLFTKENAVGINLIGDCKKTLKIYYDNIEEARNAWNELRANDKKDHLETYVKAALILDKEIDYKC